MTAREIVEAFLHELRSSIEQLRKAAACTLAEYLLVHAYVGLDHRLVHANLARIDDLAEFGRHVQAYLTGRPASD